MVVNSQWTLRGYEGRNTCEFDPHACTKELFCESEISSYISSEVSLYVPENPRKSHIGKTICCYIEIFYKFEITVINS